MLFSGFGAATLVLTVRTVANILWSYVSDGQTLDNWVEAKTGLDTDPTN
jgi:hypothetical protein